MPDFSAYDGTRLAYDVSGNGPLLVCLPGGPMQDPAYLGDLGGLTEYRRLVRLHLRGAGRSAVPEDPASYRCDRLVDDVEALCEHLGLERFDLLAHCAGANLAALYVARHPERVERLALITPSTAAVGIEVTGEARRETALLQKDEAWFGPAFAALEAILAGDATDENWKAIDPFLYGRWDAAARAHLAGQDGRRNDEAAAVYGAYTPEATRAELAAFGGRVFLLAGETDVNSAPSAMFEYFPLFQYPDFVIQEGAGHFPWVDDPVTFMALTAGFLV